MADIPADNSTASLPAAASIADPLETATPPEIPDFEMIKLIGRGTFGRVWLAKEKVSGVYRAIKTIDVSSPETEIAGLCEYQRRALAHPHLLQVFLVGQSDGAYFVVMELADDVKGNQAMDAQFYEPRSLDRLLRDRGPLPFEESMEALHGVLQAIDYLHRKGLVHRDVKPSNVLFVDGRVKLCDFGLIAPGHLAVDRAGTHGYWRPDGPTDRDSDLYAVTKVAYQMLTGASAANFAELPSDLARVTSPGRYQMIKEFLDRGCSANPARRFLSAQAMLSDVEKLYPEAALVHRNGMAPRGRPWGTWVPGAVLLLSAVVIGGWIVMSRPGAAAFAPLAEMNVLTYSATAGNPNSVPQDDPEGLLRKYSRTISTSHPVVPEWPIRYAKVHLASQPACHMLVFWISPSGYVSMASNGERARTFADPAVSAFRSLDGEVDNYVICAFLHDRPFKDPDALKEAIERLARNYRDDHPDRRPLPDGVIRVLSGGDLRVYPPDRAQPGDPARMDFGLLGEIWVAFRPSFAVVGIELPLPGRASPGQPD